MREATSVEHARCAHCRNPIRGRQACVQHVRADMSFHVDCWTDLHAQVQQDYEREVEEEGLRALVRPYNRTGMALWLPDAAIEAAAEKLTEGLDLDLDSPFVVGYQDDQSGPDTITG